MLGGNFLLLIFFGTFCFYAIIYVLSSFLAVKDETLERANTELTEPKKWRLKSIVQLIELLICIVGLFYFVLKYQIKFVIFGFIIIVFAWWVVLIPYTIGDFIHYIFMKPFEYKLTKEKENTLVLVGFLTLFVCSLMISPTIKSTFESVGFEVPLSVKDIFLMVGLTFWYFAICFFSFAFIILGLHKLIISIKAKTKNSTKTMPKEKSWQLNANIIRIYRRIVGEKIVLLHPDRIGRRIGYLISKTLWIIIEPVMIIVEVLVECLWKLLFLIFKGSFVVICMYMKRLINGLETNQGKNIMILSRVSLVFSLLCVYFVDKYQGVLSSSGSEIYEFLCSVILIPLFIAQLTELKEASVK